MSEQTAVSVSVPFSLLNRRRGVIATCQGGGEIRSVLVPLRERNSHGVHSNLTRTPVVSTPTTDTHRNISINNSLYTKNCHASQLFLSFRFWHFFFIHLFILKKKKKEKRTLLWYAVLCLPLPFSRILIMWLEGYQLNVANYRMLQN